MAGGLVHIEGCTQFWSQFVNGVSFPVDWLDPYGKVMFGFGFGFVSIVSVSRLFGLGFYLFYLFIFFVAGETLRIGLNF